MINILVVEDDIKLNQIVCTCLKDNGYAAKGCLVMDADAMTALLDNIEISLTVREFNILYKMLSYPGRTFSRSQLMDEFWGMESETSLRAVDVYITKLRDKFAACQDFKIVDRSMETLYADGFCRISYITPPMLKEAQKLRL